MPVTNIFRCAKEVSKPTHLLEVGKNNTEATIGGTTKFVGTDLFPFICHCYYCFGYCSGSDELLVVEAEALIRWNPHLQQQLAVNRTG